MTSDCQVLNGNGLLEYLLGFISEPCFLETMSIIIFVRDKNLFLIWTNIIKLFSHHIIFTWTNKLKKISISLMYRNAPSGICSRAFKLNLWWHDMILNLRSFQVIPLSSDFVKICNRFDDFYNSFRRTFDFTTLQFSPHFIKWRKLFKT